MSMKQGKSPAPTLYYTLPIWMEEGDGDGVLGYPQTSTAGPAVQRQGDAVVGDYHKPHQTCQKNAREVHHGVGNGNRQVELAEGSSRRLFSR